MPGWIIAIGIATKLVLLLLIGLSIWSVSIMVERKKAFDRLRRVSDTAKARALIRERSWGALSQWAAVQEGLQAGMLKAAIELGSNDREQVQLAVRSYLMDRRAELERGLTVLATLGSNAPFIGLFGTVLGIIQVFAVLGSTSAGTNTVMSGISEALIATAIGLFVAIPAVVAYNLFSRKLRDALVEAESLRDYYLSHLTNLAQLKG